MGRSQSRLRLLTIPQHFLPLFTDACQQGVEGLGKRLHLTLKKLLADSADVAGQAEQFDNPAPGPFYITFQGGSHISLVQKSIQCGRRSPATKPNVILNDISNNHHW